MADSDRITLGGLGDVVGRDATGVAGTLIRQILESIDPQSAQELWNLFTRNQGHYPCYAVFLILPSDREAIKYLSQFGQELDQLSNENCLIFAVSRTNTSFYGQFGLESQSPRPGFDERDWQLATAEQLETGYSVKLAKYFGVRFDEFPCLVIFRDLTLREHASVSLRDMTTQQIAREIRTIFSLVQNAAGTTTNPIETIRQQLAARAQSGSSQPSPRDKEAQASLLDDGVNMASQGDISVGRDVAGRDIVKNYVANGISVRSFGVVVVIALVLLGLIAIVALLAR